MKKHTPYPLKVAYWKDARYADGFSTVITDSRGHGLVEFLQNGKNAKVQANACLFVEAPLMFAILSDILTAHELSEVDWNAMREAKELLTRIRRQEAIK